MNVSERHIYTAALSLSMLVPLWLFNNCASDVQFSNLEVISFVDGQDGLNDGLDGPQIPSTDISSDISSDIKNPDSPSGDNLNPSPAEPIRRVVKVNQQVQIDKKPLDILFVVDNSGSMATYQQNMSERIDGFLSHIDGLDWQIAVTSTDPHPKTRNKNGQLVEWGDGQFRSFSDKEKQFLLASDESSDLSQTQLQLGRAIEMGARGSGDERGIRATYRALERRSSEIAHAAFFRQDSALAVVLISDEDECSNGSCSTKHNPEKSLPKNLLDSVKENFGENKRFVFNSFIHQPGHCPGAHRAARPGQTYQELSEATGGLTGLVCADDYGQQLSDLGELVKQLAYEVKLGCRPLDINGTGTVDLEIFSLNGDIIEIPLQVLEDNLQFTQGLPSGEYLLEYACYESEI